MWKLRFLSLSVLTAIFQVNTWVSRCLLKQRVIDGGGGDNWSYKSCKAPVKSSPPTNQHPVFLQAGCPSCRPQCRSIVGKISHSMDLLTPSSTGGLPTLSLTNNSSWLPWGRVAMSLISPLMPVPRTARQLTLLILILLKDRFQYFK